MPPYGYSSRRFAKAGRLMRGAVSSPVKFARTSISAYSTAVKWSVTAPRTRFQTSLPETVQNTARPCTGDDDQSRLARHSRAETDARIPVPQPVPGTPPRRPHSGLARLNGLPHKTKRPRVLHEGVCVHAGRNFEFAVPSLTTWRQRRTFKLLIHRHLQTCARYSCGLTATSARNRAEPRTRRTGIAREV